MEQKISQTPIIPLVLAPYSTLAYEWVEQRQNTWAQMVCDALLDDRTSDRYHVWLRKYEATREWMWDWSSIYDQSRDFGLSMKDAFYRFDYPTAKPE